MMEENCKALCLQTGDYESRDNGEECGLEPVAVMSVRGRREVSHNSAIAAAAYLS